MTHALSWYPDQVWRWLLACRWNRLAQEKAFVARTAEVSDETGSAITAAQLVRDMRLAMMLDRRYAPHQSGSVPPSPEGTTETVCPST